MLNQHPKKVGLGCLAFFMIESVRW